MPTRSTRRITVVPEDGSTEARPPWRLDVAFGAGESGVFLIDRAECRIGREADEGVEVVVPDPNGGVLPAGSTVDYTLTGARQ